jgi:hypothetical protein
VKQSRESREDRVQSLVGNWKLVEARAFDRAWWPFEFDNPAQQPIEKGSRIGRWLDAPVSWRTSPSR